MRKAQINCLPADIQTVVRKHRSNPRIGAGEAHTNLYDAFIWSLPPEGFDYWAKLNHEYSNNQKIK